MICDRCGAERPRTGPCPECGAPPPAPYSSRGRSQPGGPGGSSGSRRQSGGNYSSGGRGLLSRGGGADPNDWGDWEDTGRRGASRPGASRPGGPRSNPGYGYDPESESRALVPQYGQAMPPAAEDEIVGIPGFPNSDEEERALGIRRPAYIPATEEKRKRKLSSWRIVSGVLSLMVICVASCAGVGFLGQKTFANFFPKSISTILNPPKVNLTEVPVTPVATAGPASKNVTYIVTAQAIDTNYNAINVTSHFTVNSTVYVVMTFGSVSQSQPASFSCQWYLNGVNFGLNSSKQISSQKTTNYHAYCALQYNAVGNGQARIYWNRPAKDTSESLNDPYLAETINFAVLPPLPTATPGTPGTGTPGAGTTTPHALAPTTAPAVAWREPRSDEA